MRGRSGASTLFPEALPISSAGVVVLISVLRRGARVVLGHLHLPSGNGGDRRLAAGGPVAGWRLADLSMPRTRIGTPLGRRK